MYFTMSEHEPSEQYRQQADQLEIILNSESRGRDYPHVRYIIDDLRQGNFHRAQVDYRNQSDKFDWLPRTKQYLIEIGVA